MNSVLNAVQVQLRQKLVSAADQHHELSSSAVLFSDAAADYYEFKNGISGSGLLGFQPSLRYGIPGSENYSPIQKINIVEWINPGEAQILATENDLNDAYANKSVTITQARPLNSDHIINCPVVYPVMETSCRKQNGRG